MDFEKYKEYLFNPYMPEYADKYTTRFFMVAGWNILLDEVFSPLIEKELGMRYMGNRIWADDYCKHRRRVLSLFQSTDLDGSFKWGWNYDFVPKISGGKAVYVRTDKSVFPNFFENIHYNHDDAVTQLYEDKKNNMRFDRCFIDIADFENSMKQKVKGYTDAFYTTLPLIQAFYKETETYEQTLDMGNAISKHMYYAMIEGGNLFLTKMFLRQYIEANEDNEKVLRESIEKELTRESVLKKFYKIPKDFE